MRIGITCHPTYGGSGTVATELGIALAKRGHSIHFICTAEPYRLRGYHPNIYFHQVEAMPYPLFESPPTALSMATKMVETVRTERLDLLHVHYAVPHATSAYLARQMCEASPRDSNITRHLKVVTTLHGTDITLVGMDPSYFSITQFSILESDGVTTVSDYLRDETVERFGIAAENISVIPNFVDTERFSRKTSQAGRASYARDDEFIVMHISNFRPVKRPVDVIEIFSKLRKEIPAKLLMIGDGPLRPACHDRAEELDVLKDTWFLGRQEEVEAFLAIADIFLFPSDTESFGLAALEAMSCEVPVVATRTGGLPDVVDHGVTGYLSEVGDVKSMSEYALKLLTDPKAKAQMGKAARQRAKELFEEDGVVAKYESFYEQILNS